MRIGLVVFEKEHNITARELAKKLGITEQTYCNIKKGKSNPSIELAYKFNELYPDVNVLEIMKKKGN